MGSWFENILVEAKRINPSPFGNVNIFNDSRVSFNHAAVGVPGSAAGPGHGDPPSVIETVVTVTASRLRSPKPPPLPSIRINFRQATPDLTSAFAAISEAFGAFRECVTKCRRNLEPVVQAVAGATGGALAGGVAGSPVPGSAIGGALVGALVGGTSGLVSGAASISDISRPVQIGVSDSFGLIAGSNAALLMSGGNGVRAIASGALSGVVGSLVPGGAVSAATAASATAAATGASLAVLGVVGIGTAFGYAGADRLATSVCSAGCSR